MKRIPITTTMLGFCALLFFSCNNEDFLSQTEGGEPCDYICFSIPTDEGAQTKGSIQADAKEYTSDRFVLRSADSADTLCVRTIVSEGIQGAAADQAITRGTPITAEAFYDNFHVLTVRDQESSFFMNEDVTKTGNSWTMDNTYYWPGADHTLQFYAWAPANAITAAPTSPNNMTFTYTVPTDATKQQDLVVANESHKGDFNQVVSLSFQHICTAVKFVVGEHMQAGTIKSVALKGVQNTGTYNMTTEEWTSISGTADFTQTLDIVTTGSESENTEITPADGTFMMLPQTLPAGAKVVVEFHDNVANKDRTLEALIDGTEWPMGKTVTYKLTITPDYDMSITCETDKVDAHVDIEEITIKADGPWVLSSGVDWLTFTDWSYDTSKPEERPLGHRGYWIRSESGKNTFSGSGNKTLYAYYDENLGNESRTANITLTYPGTSKVGAQKTVIQYCPAWNGNAGYERFEEDHRWEEDGSKTFTYPFGFAWDRKVEFTAEPKISFTDFSFRDLLGAYVFLYIANNAIENYDASEYVTVKEESEWWSLGLTCRTIVTIDYSKFNAIGDLVTTDNGLINTRNLYGFQNIGQISAIENVLRDNAVGNFGEHVIEDSHQNIPVDQFAARRIAMKNEFTKVYRESEVEGETIRYAEAIINVNDIDWYLPAINEQASLKNGLTEGDEPLEGVYWSSTAVDNNIDAYTYDSEGITATANRMLPYKMRAAVRKP